MEVARPYAPEELLRLRQSPLVKKPPDLPPPEEWMGQASENARPRTGNNDRNRGHEASILEQNNRRPGIDRHISRGSANPEDIILGPPKTSFASASTSMRHREPLDRSSIPRNEDSRDRFNLRKLADGENERPRDGRGALRPRRGDDQDSDGWSTVKPRKSFGTEGAERFNGRMGGDRGIDRQRDDRRDDRREGGDRRFRDRVDHETRERPSRGFDNFSREKDVDHDQEGRRNGNGRARNEPSWFSNKDSNDMPATPGDRKSNGDRFGNRNWREKDEKTLDRERERPDERSGDRRWDRDRNDRHQERDPEWMDEPIDTGKEARTQEDFQKWKERMKAGTGSTPFEITPSKLEGVDTTGQTSFFGLEKPKVETPVVLDNEPTGPDKFFETWAQKPKAEANADPALAVKQDGPVKAATVGKASRFTSFFSKEEKDRRQTEPPPPVPVQQQPEDTDREKQDFQKLLQKLQSQSFGLSTPTPPANPASQPRAPPQEPLSSTPSQPQDPFMQYRPEHNEQPSRNTNRDSQKALQDLLLSRQAAASQPRPDQVIQDLVNQRQNALSQGSSRPDSRPNSNTEFLMNLMQNARVAPEPLRAEPHMMRGPPPQQIQPDRERQLQQMAEREQEMQREQRERSASQRQRRPDVPPGFFEDNLFQQRGPQPQQHEPGPRREGPLQPTQILQRPPPGLDQAPPGWNPPNGQLPPMMPNQRHIAPPPGLQGGRGMPPPGMFPPGFPPMNNFGPPPEGMGPPRNMGPPPPGFMMPPPGFPGGPPLGFPGPEGMNFGGPYDGRGPPPGNFRR